MKNNNKGFTLIELLVVIAIIGLLSTLAVVSLNNARTKSRDAKRVADIKTVQTALEMYFNDKGVYPIVAAPGSALGAGNNLALSSAGFTNVAGITAPTYMGKVPANPTPAATGGPTYLYLSTDGSTYSITFVLEADMTSLGGDACVANPVGISCT